MWDFLFSLYYHNMALWDEWTMPYTMYVKSPLFSASFLPCDNPDDHSSYGSGHAIPTFFFFSFLDWYFHLLHTVSYRGSSDLYSYFGYHVSLHWLQGGRVLYLVVLTLDFWEYFFMDSCASCCLYFTDIRFNMWT